MIFLIFFLSIFISVMIILVSFFLSKKDLMGKEKGSSFECGFDSLILSRSSFSLQFFLIGIIFLIFDVEVVLIFPLPVCMGWDHLMILVFNVFVLILLYGLYFEWMNKGLEWMV